MNVPANASSYVPLEKMPNAFPTAMGFRSYHMKHHSHLSTYDYDADVPSDWEARLVGNRSYMKAAWLFFFASSFPGGTGSRGFTRSGADDVAGVNVTFSPALNRSFPATAHTA